jgi:hypothetical protein
MKPTPIPSNWAPRLAGEWKRGESEGAQTHAQQGDHARRQRVEPDVDEQERGTPDRRHRHEQRRGSITTPAAHQPLIGDS